MAEKADTVAGQEGPAGRALFGIARFLAILGGLLSCVMAALVSISVAGRYLMSRPVPGDYDLIGILCGCAVFAFLPYCQLQRSNVIADFFTQGASERTKSKLDASGNVLFLAAAIMFTWRLYYGMLEMRDTGEQIAAFAFYRWWTLPFDIFCLVILVWAIAYTLVQDISKATSGPSTAAGGAPP